jgi:uncharacterized protein (TIGR03435 family)
MNTATCAAMMALGTLLAHVMATAQVRPQFDIADVHLSPANPNPAAIPMMQGGVARDGVYRIQTATMVDLIKTAYGVDAEKVQGGPSWLELDRFDIVAKVPASTSADTARLMLQSLLADRFTLVLHEDSRPMPGFALKVGKAPKLKRASGAGNGGCKSTALYTDAELGARRQAATQAGEKPVVLQTFLHACRNMTMTAFAEGMRNMAGAFQYFDTGTVVDQTGLSGEWDFDLRYSQKPPPSAAALGVVGENITIFDAIDRQLGLNLEAASIPTPVVVVDRVNRTPSDNPPGVSAILPAPPPAAFEVATLRLSDPNAPEVRSPGPLPGGRFEVRNFSLKQLIVLAWGLSGSELTGAPAWLDSARVDLTAKLPSTEATREIVGVVDINAFQPALRALLIERLKLAIHTEQQPGSGYALVAAKPKLQRADPATRTKCLEGPGADGKDPRVSNPLLSRLVTCRNITMKEFAEQLPRLSRGYIQAEVLDLTGITGSYDFVLSFSTPVAQAAASGPGATDPVGGLTIFAALERQLGLKLEKSSVRVPVIVLDHIEQTPADN